MTRLPATATDADLIRFVDGWAALLEREDYAAAFTHTDHVTEMAWTPELIRRVIKSYGDADPDQRVTVDGRVIDVTQRKEVTRRPTNPHGYCGYIWYDLNIDGLVTDLTATFHLRVTSAGLSICLNDIHVM